MFSSGALTDPILWPAETEAPAADYHPLQAVHVSKCASLRLVLPYDILRMGKPSYIESEISYSKDLVSLTKSTRSEPFS